MILVIVVIPAPTQAVPSTLESCSVFLARLNIQNIEAEKRLIDAGYLSVEQLIEAPPTNEDFKNYGFTDFQRNKILKSLQGGNQGGTQGKRKSINPAEDEPFIQQILPLFDPSKYQISFPLLDPNDDDLSLLGRKLQLEGIRETILDLPTAKKYLVPVISTSRGMGKTFLLKRIGFHREEDAIDIPCVEAAGKVGRVISMSCPAMVSAFYGNANHLMDYFWHATLLYHICFLFQDRTVSKIPFRHISLERVASFCRQSAQIDPTSLLDLWLNAYCGRAISNVVSELIRLTNTAFGVTTDVKPVFLIDEIQVISKIDTNIQSTLHSELKHTVLIQILDKFHAERYPCIVAGTSVGPLPLLADYTNFIPIPIFLTSFSMDDVNKVSQKIVTRLNTSTLEPITLPNIEDDPLLTAMIYSTCQVPRLVVIAIEIWHKNKSEKETNTTIIHQFTKKAREYYKDSISRISCYPVKDVALLMLCCSVYFPLTKNIPGTSLLIQDLIQEAIIFPYFGDTYTLPSFFWSILLKDKSDEFWEKVQNELKNLVPGVDFMDLHLPFEKWLHITDMMSLTQLGHIWEKMVASALVVKYKLVSLETHQTILPLKKIIDISEFAQAYRVVSKYQVDLSGGVIIPSKGDGEVKLSNLSFEKAVVANYHFIPAHHDLILCTTSRPIPIQCKNTLIPPDGSSIKSQLSGQYDLFWCYPGLKEDDEDPPRNFKDKTVKSDLNRIAFLSAGFVSSLSLEVLRSLKNLKSIEIK